MKLNGTDNEIVSCYTIATDIDFHCSKNLIFWTDSQKVYSQAIRGGKPSQTVLVEKMISVEITSIAVDFVTDKLYVLRNFSGRPDVGIFALNGKFESLVHLWSILNPTYMTLDPYSGFMFIANKESVRSFEEIDQVEKEEYISNVLLFCRLFV